MSRSLENKFILLTPIGSAPMAPKRELTVAFWVNERPLRFPGACTLYNVPGKVVLNSDVGDGQLALWLRRARVRGSPGDPVILEDPTWAHSPSEYMSIGRIFHDISGWRVNRPFFHPSIGDWLVVSSYRISISESFGRTIPCRQILENSQGLKII